VNSRLFKGGTAFLFHHHIGKEERRNSWQQEKFPAKEGVE